MLLLILTIYSGHLMAQQFKVLAFYTARQDLAHISFVHEANKWFAEQFPDEISQRDDGCNIS